MKIKLITSGEIVVDGNLFYLCFRLMMATYSCRNCFFSVKLNNNKRYKRKRKFY